ncbi:polygalacturonase QRT3-like [Prunus yedoensis var. nudiflora]|uniref:Polygalacturonase QRT3-like n=1 Tax=Prunus yedoensis var. nudiflora TaxID=2094558 RepID=A0A314YD81_PRUYE|nr:polygalacturonase QRT3-like [Prunus yedoensis var. nudiflora]
MFFLQATNAVSIQSFQAALFTGSSSNVTMNGRVFYPIGYGADPTGAEDSIAALLKAVEEAFQLKSRLELLPGITDLRGVVIDL